MYQRPVDRAIHAWIADDRSRSTVRNSLAVLVQVMEQVLRDGIIDRNPARVSGWRRQSATGGTDQLKDNPTGVSDKRESPPMATGKTIISPAGLTPSM